MNCSSPCDITIDIDNDYYIKNTYYITIIYMIINICGILYMTTISKNIIKNTTPTSTLPSYQSINSDTSNDI